MITYFFLELYHATERRCLFIEESAVFVKKALAQVIQKKFRNSSGQRRQDPMVVKDRRITKTLHEKFSTLATAHLICFKLNCAFYYYEHMKYRNIHTRYIIVDLKPYNISRGLHRNRWKVDLDHTSHSRHRVDIWQ